MDTCPHPKAERRDEDVCGTCYGEALLREPLPVGKPRAAVPVYPCCGRAYLVKDAHHHH